MSMCTRKADLVSTYLFILQSESSPPQHPQRAPFDQHLKCLPPIFLTASFSQTLGFHFHLLIFTNHNSIVFNNVKFLLKPLQEMLFMLELSLENIDLQIIRLEFHCFNYWPWKTNLKKKVPIHATALPLLLFPQHTHKALKQDKSQPILMERHS